MLPCSVVKERKERVSVYQFQLLIVSGLSGNLEMKHLSLLVKRSRLELLSPLCVIIKERVEEKNMVLSKPISKKCG